MFVFGKRSEENLKTVDTRLSVVAYKALRDSPVDFAVIEGLRSRERHLKLLAAGATRVQHSKHETGMAIDVMAYVDGRGCWELPPYYKIINAFREVAERDNVPLRWGGCWRMLVGLPPGAAGLEHAVRRYIRERVERGKDPFVDACHLEIRDE